MEMRHAVNTYRIVRYEDVIDERGCHGASVIKTWTLVNIARAHLPPTKSGGRIEMKIVYCQNRAAFLGEGSVNACPAIY